MIIEVHDKEDVGRVLTAANKLRQTGISMHRDYPAASRVRRRRLLRLKSEITKKSNIKTQMKGNSLQVGENIFYFNINNKFMCDDDGAMMKLQKLLGDSLFMTLTAEVENDCTRLNLEGANTSGLQAADAERGLRPSNNQHYF